jgi:hypothetical protein
MSDPIFNHFPLDASRQQDKHALLYHQEHTRHVPADAAAETDQGTVPTFVEVNNCNNIRKLDAEPNAPEHHQEQYHSNNDDGSNSGLEAIEETDQGDIIDIAPESEHEEDADMEDKEALSENEVHSHSGGLI